MDSKFYLPVTVRWKTKSEINWGAGHQMARSVNFVAMGLVGALAAPHTPRHGYPPILLAFIEKTASDEAHFSSVTFPAEATRWEM